MKKIEESQLNNIYNEKSIYTKIRAKIRFGDVLVVYDLSDLGEKKGDYQK